MTVEIKTKKILCIDDDPGLLKIVRQILEKNFSKDVLEIFEARDGAQGLQMTQNLEPDIILSDIHMAEMDGFEICKRVRQQGINAAVILMSAYDVEQDHAIRAREAGADAFLAKPIKKGELLFAVNFVLRVASLNEAITTKNHQLEQSVSQLRQFQHKLTALNEELKADKRRLNENLKEVVQLNHQLESKNTQILSMNAELAGRFESTVKLLSNIIELHQSQHRGHAERVARISTYIAKKMGLPEQQANNIKTAALVHELGIVSLPSEQKVEEAVDETSSRKLTSHPLVAEMLLKSFPGFELVSNIIRHLHENVDGSGVPDHLTGDRIPIGSRIVSMASYFDHALMAGEQISQEKAFSQVEGQSGSMFDEKLVALLSDWVAEQNPEKQATFEVNIFSLKEGMELASDIYSESGINLLRKGTVLKKDILNRVLKFHNVDPILGAIKVKRK